MSFSDLSRRFPTVDFVDTARGDVTVHVRHVVHAAPPPAGTGTGRRTLYLGFGR